MHPSYGSLLALGIKIGCIYPYNRTINVYKELMRSGGGFPPVPTKGEVDNLSHMFDDTICLPCVVKKKRVDIKGKNDKVHNQATNVKKRAAKVTRLVSV